MNKYENLRNKYTEFIYKKCTKEIIDNNLHITYYFEIPGLVEFTPTTDIPLNNIDINTKDDSFINELIFHVGLVELISYWKCACPKNVIIEAGYINEEQINWFKKLYFHGLGEFFYTNGITPSIEDFMNIEVRHEETCFNPTFTGTGTLIPIGGGKDSCVTLELLAHQDNNSCFIINPKPVTLECAKLANYDSNNTITPLRRIDKNLLELNKQGFLNGHTPFSSMVAFLSYLTAYLYDKKYIALSNESSANESNVEGTKINHQYSKTYEFESDFNYYTNKFFNIDIKYFSLLRPLAEYQIGMLFSKYEKYHPVFKSCNVGSKGETWEWCCNCPKCLFVYSILSPYLYKDKLINIFGDDMYENKDMLQTFIELLGRGANKPFECVGTYEEVNYAISKTIINLESNNEPLPYLLQYYKDNFGLLDINKIDLETRYNEEHHLNEYFEEIIKKAINYDTTNNQ